MDQRPGIRTLFPQYKWQSYPYPPCLLEVYNDLWPFIIHHSEKWPKVPEGLHHLQWISVSPEMCCCYRPCLLIYQPPYFLVCAPYAGSSVGVAVVECHPRHKHVTFRSAGLGTVPFLQNHYSVPHVVVHKLNPEVGVHRCLPSATLHWAPCQSGWYRERDPVEHGVWWQWHCLPLGSLDRPMECGSIMFIL